ncbi:MAG: hypothetical protein HS122_09800 [Opitutaceae bacterium]|nr:hypothetical protein [Opitutaceae bacterium]
MKSIPAFKWARQERQPLVMLTACDGVEHVVPNDRSQQRADGAFPADIRRHAISIVARYAARDALAPELTHRLNLSTFPYHAIDP